MSLRFVLGNTNSFTAGTDLGYTTVRQGDVLGMSERAEGGEPAAFGLTFEDIPGTLNVRALRPFWIDELSASPTRVWTGYVADRKFSRQPDRGAIVGTSRYIDATLVDLNAVFKIRLLRQPQGAIRPAENAAVRLAWLIANMTPAIFDKGQVADLSAWSMGKTDYRDMYAQDILDDIAGRTGTNYFAYWNAATAQIALYIQRAAYTGYTSSLRLSNVATDIDNVTTFAAQFELTKDPSDVYSGISYVYAGGRTYQQNTATGTAFISRDMLYVTGSKPTRTVAISRAQQILVAKSTESARLYATCVLPKAAVNLALNGQMIQVKASEFEDFTAFTSIRAVTRSVSMPGPDDKYVVQFELFTPHLASGGPPAQPIDTTPFVPDCGQTVDMTDDIAAGKTLVAQGDLAANAANMPLAVDVNDATTALVNLSVVGAGTHICRMRFDNGSAVYAGASRVFVGSDLNPTSPAISVQYSDDDVNWFDILSWTDLNTAPGHSVGDVTVQFTPQSHRYWGITYTHTVGGLTTTPGTNYYTWSLYGTDQDCNEPAVNQPIAPEASGTGNGTSSQTFTTNYPYLPGSLLVTVNGVRVIPVETNPALGTFTLTPAPPPGASVVVSYQAADPTTTGAGNPVATPTTSFGQQVTTVEASLVSAPDARRGGHFQITGLTGLTAGKQVVVSQAAGPYTGKGTRADEAEMDQVTAVGKVLNATTIDVYWEANHRVRGNFKFNYIVSA